MKRFKPLKAESVGLITNYRCTFECDHCLYCASPNIREEINDEHLKEVILQIDQALGGVPLHIGGGEPLLNLERIRHLLLCLRKTSIILEYVETNGSPLLKNRHEKLQALKKDGLECLLLSMSPFHNAFIPLKSIKEIAQDVVRIFGRQGLFPWHPGFLPFMEKISSHETIHWDRYFRHFPEVEIRRQLTSVMYIHPGGRAAFLLGKHLPCHTVDALLEKKCIAALSSPVHAHLDYEGNYFAGFCSGLRLGENVGFSLERLYGDGILLTRYPILDILVNKGIRGLYEHGLSAGYTQRSKGYVSPCHLCLDIRIHLYFHEKRYPELYPRFFYEHLKSRLR